MNGKVNTQNVRQYAPRGQAPEFTYQVSESQEKRAVWVGLCGDGSLIGPYFFESNVTGLAYVEMSNEKVFPAVLCKREFGGLKMEIPLTVPRKYENGSLNSFRSASLH